ncbi:MAG TPA: MBL fold metallo-hydrolase [Acidobacteriaceae bacterium]|nr:MBL fold metallo-hydrolase [Acidobacteriaceae bacterium]
MNLTFRGVRGSLPTPQANRLRYGGNTTCLEIGTPDPEQALLIDCGSGARELGDQLLAGAADKINILFTHFHWDHIQGLPYFAPLFNPRFEVVFWARRPEDELRRCLRIQMDHPFFPLPLDEVPARVQFRSVRSGEPFEAAGLRIECFPLCHPQGAAGYRLEGGAGAIVHASDHECGLQQDVDDGIRRAAQGARLLVMDAQYTPEEHAGKIGWGHSSFAHAAQIARDAGVERLALFHHDPAHDDDFLDAMLARAQEIFPFSIMARERETL